METNNMGIEDGNLKKETPEGKFERVNLYVLDYLNKIAGLSLAVNMAPGEEEMHKQVKAILETYGNFSILPLEKNPAKPKLNFATPSDVLGFFPEYATKLGKLYDTLSSDNFTKEEFRALYDDIWEYVSRKE